MNLKSLTKLLFITGFFVIIFSCTQPTVIPVVNSSDNQSETTDVSRLTAIYYDGKTHISWNNPNGIEGVEIFSNGSKIECDIKTVASSVYGNYSYCILENSQAGKSYIVKTKNQAGQLSSGMAVSVVKTRLPVVNINTENRVDVKDKVNKIPAKINILNSGNLKNPKPDAAITINNLGPRPEVCWFSQGSNFIGFNTLVN